MASSQAIAYHSITIGEKNTWDDWHLVPLSRPKFVMPPVKTNYIDIPGSDGLLDLTTALSGRPTYGNRQGSFEFLVMNDYGEWYERYSEIASYLHGREFRATLDDDPTYYYEGRFSVNEWKSEPQWSQLVIDYSVGPYKKSILSSSDMWLWDPFDFSVSESDVEPNPAGVIKNYKNLIVNGSALTVTYVGDIYEEQPVFRCSKYGNTEFDMTVQFETGSPIILKQGINTINNRSFNAGSNTLIFSGHGIVTIDNMGGRL